ncbi:MerR family transcriptional regulator [Aeribacillus alveayuensis]|uniref:MerR family transcriptional regulator n=1 Tax=Aeribacillus alveayuensis TaxID=279215 RepID=UPI0005CD3457|nr:MerR family transcriptional regulator [Bacillus alveayuensis]
MKSYTLREFATLIGVPPKTIKQWEKDFKAYISVPRTKQGARIYTEAEINFFQNIKALYEKKLKKQEIMNFLKAQDTELNTEKEMMVANEEKMATDSKETTLHFQQEDIRKKVEEYVANIVKEETDKVIEHVDANLLDLKNCIRNIVDSNEATADSLIHSIQQLKEATEHHGQTIQQKLDNFQDTNKEILEEFKETLQEEKEEYFSMLERERSLYEQKIIERERAFRALVLSFRESAAAEMKKTKKWWKFWTMLK